jgi:hypothetical protein
MDLQKDMQQQLYASRVKLRREMQRALACISKPSRRKLAAEWKKTYSEIFYQELVNCARNKQVRLQIARWDDEQMGKPE